MTKYLSYSQQMPAPRLSTIFRINLVDPEKHQTRNVSVRGIEESTNGIRHLVGLLYRSSFEADNIGHAFDVSKNDFEFVGSLISFITGVSAAPIRPYVIFSNEKGADSQEFCQFIFQKGPKWGIGDVNPKDVKKIITGYNKIKKRSASNRIVSSLRFYSKAQSTNDPVERFLLLWIAVEYLDYLLVKKMAENPARRCSECKALLQCRSCGKKAEAPTTAGLIDFASKASRGVLKNLEESIELRNRLFHRETNIAKAASDADRLNRFLVTFYIRVIRNLLGLGQKPKVSRKLVHAIDCFAVISEEVTLPREGTLSNLSSKVPHFEWNEQVTHMEKRPGGKMSQTQDVVAIPKNFPQGFGFRNEVVQSWAVGVKPRVPRLKTESHE